MICVYTRHHKKRDVWSLILNVQLEIFFRPRIQLFLAHAHSTCEVWSASCSFYAHPEIGGTTRWRHNCARTVECDQKALSRHQIGLGFGFSAWMQHYSLLVGHMLSYLSSLMVVEKIDLRVSYTLGAFAAMSGVKGKENLTLVLCIWAGGFLAASYLEWYRIYWKATMCVKSWINLLGWGTRSFVVMYGKRHWLVVNRRRACAARVT